MPSMSRFHVHDELSAPEGSVPVLRGALATAGQLPNFLGVLAGSPAALRGYARFRSELRHGSLAAADARAHLARGGRASRLRARARDAQPLGAPRRPEPRRDRERTRFESVDPREAALLRYLRALVEDRGSPPLHLHEEAREAGWSDEQMLEAIAFVALESFTAMVNVAGDVPVDGSTEKARLMAA